MNVHDLATPYALNSLEPDERSQFEAHLESCGDCRMEVSEALAVAARLGAAESADPGPALRAAVLSGIDDIEQESPPGTPVAPAMPRRRTPWLAAAALGMAAAVIALAFIVFRLDDRVSRMDAMRDVMAAPDAAIATLDGGLGFQFYYSVLMDQAVLVSDQVPGVATDETYEFWLIDTAGPQPAGLFRPSDGAITLLVDGGLAGAQVVGVTIEPEGGSDAPTGDILASAAIG